MYLIVFLCFCSIFQNTVINLLVLCIFLFKLLKDSYIKEASLLVLVFVLFSVSLNFNFISSSNKYKVISTQNYKTILRQGINKYELLGQNDLEIGDLVYTNKYRLKEKPNNYEKMNRIIATIDQNDIDKTKSTKSYKEFFYRKLKQNEYLFDFFDNSIETIFSLLSLQLIGLLKIIDLIFERFFYKTKYIRLFTILLYGYLFGMSFGVIRILLKEIFQKLDLYLPIIQVIYPHFFYSPSFIIVFMPYIIRNLSSSFNNLNYILLRTFFLLFYIGRIHLLEIILYPLLTYIAGLIVFLSLIFNFKLASYLLIFSQKVISSNRFLILGSPPIFFLVLLFKSKRKNQIISFMFILLYLTYTPFTRVSMINVYQGDATLISLPFNTMHVLIDTGRKSAYKTLKQNLYKHGVKEIDYLVITHDDADHCENKEILMKEFKVKHLIETKDQDIPFFRQLLKDKNYGDDNEDSLILEFVANDTRFLFMGDAHVKQEKDIIMEESSLKVDVLKLGHHGSKTSTSIKFLEHLKPTIALISSDPRIYNHPHPEVMENLNAFKIVDLQTSIEGTVSFNLLPFFNIIVSERFGFGIMK